MLSFSIRGNALGLGSQAFVTDAGGGARSPVALSTSPHLTNSYLHQSSPRCRSPRCIPVVAESYHQRRADVPGRSKKMWPSRVGLDPPKSLARCM
jgi:hypothetical protein